MANKIKVEFDFVGNAQGIKKTIADIENQVQGMNLEPAKKNGLNSIISSMKRDFADLQSITEDGFISQKDIKRAQDLTNKIQKGFISINKETKKLGVSNDLFPAKTLNQFKQANSLINDYIDSNQKYKSLLEKIQDLEQKKATAQVKRQKVNYTSSDAGRLASLTKKQNSGTQLSETEQVEYTNLQAKSQEAAKHTKDINSATAALNRAQAALAKINTTLQSSQGFTQLVEKLKEMGIEGVDASSTIEEIQQTVTKLEVSKLQELTDGLDDVSNFATQGGTAIEDFGYKVDNAEKELESLTRRSDDVQQLKNQVLAFFSIGNGVQLFRRAVQSAVSTIKELDEVMTETAVVTDYSVSDMWDQLSRYTEIAKELGATTKGAYETMTLYFQQGLNEEEAFALGTETMKMARIAGMDYANTTDAMTAALRGFNMELNETSAQRINDVYSELAAVTASNTQEISTAMSKTASIASMAGMEFEETATFLAKAIETTREAPENIGTAMKTIVARYSALTKDPSTLSEDLQDALNGETVDVNSVTAALSSAGVNALTATGEFRDLGDVMTELSSKWDTLDSMTQHYVATQFAGNRQQSRFIAMMQDYGRTQELLSDAYNSSGASQEQFDKTMESLTAKLNRLNDAWDQFLMGITNSDVVKLVVDLLYQVINALNKITDILPGVTKGFAKLFVTWGMFKGGRAIFSGLTTTMSKEGRKAGKKFGSELKAELLGEFQGVGPALKRIWQDTGWNTDDIKNKFKNTFNSDFDSNALTGKIKTVQSQLKNLMEKTGLESKTIKTNTLKFFGFDSKEASNIAKKLKQGNEAITAELRQQLAEKGLILSQDGATLILENKRLGINKILTRKFWEQKAVLGLNYWQIALIVAAVGALVVAWKKFSPEGKLKTAQEQTKKITEAAEDAKEAYSNLNNSLSEYDNKVSTLNSLTEDTAEWTQALVEANNVILELLDNYPQLAEYITTNDQELMTISTEGIDAFKEQLANAAKTTQTATTIAKIVENNAQKTANTNSIYNKKAGTTTTVTALEQQAVAVKNASLDVENESLIKTLGAGYGSIIQNSTGNIDNLVKTAQKTYQGWNKLLLQQQYKARTGKDAGDLKKNELKKSLAYYDVADQYININDAVQTWTDTLTNTKKIDVGSLFEGLIKGEDVSSLLNKNIDWTTLTKNIDWTSDEFTQLANQLGYTTTELQTKIFDGFSNAQWADKQLKGKLETASDDDIAAIRSFLQNNRNSLENRDYSGLSTLTSQQLLELSSSDNLKEKGTFGKIARAAQTEFQSRRGENIYNSSQYTEDSNDTALDSSVATQTGYSVDAIQNITTQLQLENDALAKNTELAEVNARVTAQVSDSISKLNGDYATQLKLVINGNNNLKTGAKYSKDYAKAFDDILQVTRELVGVDVDASFLQNSKNLKLLEKAAEGDTDAIAELKAEAGKTLPTSWTEAETDHINTLMDAAENLNGFSIAPDISLDDENFLDTLNEMLKAGEITAKDAQAYLNSIGYEGTMKQVPKKIPHDYEVYLGKAQIARVHAEETVMIPQITNAKSIGSAGIGAGVKGSGSTGSSGSGGSGGGSGGGSSSKWENPFKKWDNALEKVEKLIRKADLLNKKYELYIKDSSKTPAEIHAVFKQLMKTYQQTEKQAKTGKSQAQKEVNKRYNGNLVNDKGKVKKINGKKQSTKKYITYDEESGAYVLTKAGKTAVNKGKKLGQYVAATLEQLRTNQEAVEDFEDKELDAQDAQRELLESNLSGASSFWQNLTDVFDTDTQNQIDILSDINDSINDSNQRLMDAINKSISKIRQDRENSKTEQNINDKRAQLALLKRDTSGANAAKIKQLEKEIADEEEAYSDSLVDQQIQDMQDTLDQAAEQRERQIELLQELVDQNNDDEIWQWLDQYVDKETGEISEEGKAQLWDQIQNNKNLNDFEKISLYKQLLGGYNEFVTFFKENPECVALLQQSIAKGWVDEIIKAIRESGDGQYKVQYSGKDITIGGKDFKNGETYDQNMEWKDNAGNKYKAEFNQDGTLNNVTRTSTETKTSKNGKKTTTETNSVWTPETNKWTTTGSKTTTTSGKTTDKKGKTTTVVEKDADGNVTGSKKTVTTDKNGKRTTTITTKDGEGNVTGEKTVSKILKSARVYIGTSKKYDKMKATHPYTDDEGSVLFKDGKYLYKNVTWNKNKKRWQVNKNNKISYKKPSTSIKSADAYQELSAQPTSKPAVSWSLAWALRKLGYDDRPWAEFKTQPFDKIETDLWTNFNEKNGIAGDDWNSDTKNFLSAKGYKTGGLADYTGPAWLDGTPTSPELVLNAEDTKNFIQLKNILASLMDGSSLNGNISSGDTTINLDIKVDQMASDYDAEKLAKQIEKKITQSANYRNVSTVRRTK